MMTFLYFTHRLTFVYTHIYAQFLICQHISRMAWSILSHSTWRISTWLTCNSKWDILLCHSLVMVTISFLLTGTFLLSCEIDYDPCLIVVRKVLGSYAKCCECVTLLRPQFGTRRKRWSSLSKGPWVFISCPWFMGEANELGIVLIPRYPGQCSLLLQLSQFSCITEFISCPV